MYAIQSPSSGQWLDTLYFCPMPNPPRLLAANGLATSTYGLFLTREAAQTYLDANGVEGDWQTVEVVPQPEEN